jgi:predicted PurR-regulated permease PerM
MGPTAAALSVTLAGGLAIIGITGLAVIELAGRLPDLIDQAAAGAAAVAGSVGLGEAPVDLVRALGFKFDVNVRQLLDSVTAGATVILLVVMLTYFFLRDGRSWWQRALTRVSASRRVQVARIGTEAADTVQGWMAGTATIGLFAAVAQWAIMTLLGLPFAVPVGVLTFFGTFIPYIGDAVTTILGFLVAVAVGDPTDVVVMAIYTVVINVIQGNVLAPLVYSRRLSLHPAVVLLAIPAGAQIGGLFGMLVAVPLLGVVSVTRKQVMELISGAAADVPAQVATNRSG